MIYNPPPDFTLQSPPFYRPASSVTLICVAEDGSTPVNYQWSSTCSSCFASSGLTDRITTDILKSTDAGTHTCTVTDAEGNTGYASTEMKLIGTLIILLVSFMHVDYFFTTQVLVFMSHRVNIFLIVQSPTTVHYMPVKHAD